jgi:hypothetical protein
LSQSARDEQMRLLIVIYCRSSNLCSSISLGYIFVCSVSTASMRFYTPPFRSKGSRVHIFGQKVIGIQPQTSCHLHTQQSTSHLAFCGAICGEHVLRAHLNKYRTALDDRKIHIVQISCAVGCISRWDCLLCLCELDVLT